MLALPLLLALAVTADPPAAPAAPEAVAQAPAAEEAEGTGEIVAPPGLPEAAPQKPAAPFVLQGFMDPTRVSTGASVRAGLSTSGLTTALDATARWHGVILGATVGIASELGSGNGSTGLRTMGLLVGYGMQRGLYRGEALLGWGVTDERVRTDAGTFSETGHFTSLQAALDRVMWGGDSWRGALGLVTWWRSVDPNAAATLATLKSEFGVGVRIGAEVGW